MPRSVLTAAAGAVIEEHRLSLYLPLPDAPARGVELSIEDEGDGPVVVVRTPEGDVWFRNPIPAVAAEMIHLAGQSALELVEARSR